MCQHILTIGIVASVDYLLSAERIRFQLRRPSEREGGVCCKPELGGRWRRATLHESFMHWGPLKAFAVPPLTACLERCPSPRPASPEESQVRHLAV
jgi:hypothetical protein